MDKMTIEKIREMLCREVDEIVEKGELSAGDLDTLHKLTDTIKNVDKIEMLEQDDYALDDGYSEHGRGGDWVASGTYARNGGRMYSMDDEMRRYDRGNSYRRDRMGRYSRADAENDLMKKLRDMAQDGNLPERYRQTARKAIEEMK